MKFRASEAAQSVPDDASLSTCPGIDGTSGTDCGTAVGPRTGRDSGECTTTADKASVSMQAPIGSPTINSTEGAPSHGAPSDHTRG